MGNNVVYLADVAVPSYRRLRAPTSGSVNSSAATTGWRDAARRRAAQKQIAQPGRALAMAHVQALASPTDGAVASTGVEARSAFIEGRSAAIGQKGAFQGAPAAPMLRVTHLVDAWQAPGCSGRLRISGRLIDVCTELDRLAAAEAQAALPRRA